ncbi:hypothetical protein NFI96_005955 [Prochilodus magdalenae]|nr:hypothetical protein NFI96_005955 [Prochilodus magdalenae]
MVGRGTDSIKYQQNLWKGENVATTEVSDIITQVDFIKEGNVYGVQVPGHEGRVGMAAVTIKEGAEFDGIEMFNHVTKHLPNYAEPRFLRIQSAVEVTGTFKQVKRKLVEEGFNPGGVSEPLYFLSATERSYVPLTEPLYNSIIQQRICCPQGQLGALCYRTLLRLAVGEQIRVQVSGVQAQSVPEVIGGLQQDER